MKKIIGILGVAFIAITLFFSSSLKRDNDMDLASLMSMNIANAETYLALGCDYTGTVADKCYQFSPHVVVILGCKNNPGFNCYYYY